MSEHWPEDPYGDMAPILRASLEASKARHPSGKMKGFNMVTEPIMDEAVSIPAGATPVANVLTKDDRCDHCGAEAAYRVTRPDLAINDDPERSGNPTLDFCMHAWRKNFPTMSAAGWIVLGANTVLLAAIGAEGS